LVKNVKLRVVEIRTAADYEQMQHRQEAVKAAFRQGIGYVDPAEVRRIAEQKSPDEPLSAGVLAATALVAQREAQLAKEESPAGGLISMLMGGFKATVGEMLHQRPDVPADKRGEIAAKMNRLFSSAVDSGSEDTHAQNMFTLM